MSRSLWGIAPTRADAHARAIQREERRTRRTARTTESKDVLSLEHSERSMRGIALDYPYWVHLAAMSLGGPLNSICLRGGYSRVVAAGVSQWRARRTWPNFSGRASSMLAFRTSRLERIGAVSAASIRHAESMTYAPRSGVVAQPLVARHGQGLAIASFLSMRPLIANLTTRADLDGMGTGGRSAPAGCGAGAFPLSGARPLPHLPGARRAGNLGNFQEGARSVPSASESRTTLRKFGESQNWQTGSGVGGGAQTGSLGVDRAESGRRQTGRGYIGAHLSLGAGRRSSLRAPWNPVNGASAQKYPRGVWYGSQGPQRMVIGPCLAAFSARPGLGGHWV